MIPPIRRLLSYRGLLPMLLSALLLTATSCNDDEPTEPCPPGKIGAVEGYLLAGGIPAVATIGARCAGGIDAGEVMFTTTSDSSGWYRLEMPLGAYRIEVDPSSGIHFPVRDTVHVGPEVQRLDIAKGRGTVRLRFPIAIAGRWVQLSMGDKRLRQKVPDDGWTVYEFPLLEPGPTPIGVDESSTIRWFYLPGVSEAEDATLIDIPTDHIFHYEDALSSSAVIRGSIRGSWQQISDNFAEVEAYTVSDSSRVGAAWVEDDGSFLLVLLRSEPVKLRCEIRRIGGWIGGQNTYATATVYHPSPGGEINDVSHVENGILITLDHDGSPASYGASILVRDEAGRTWIPNFHPPSTPISNLPAGRYYVRASCWCSGNDQSWAGQWFDGAGTLSEATPIDLADGQLVSITMHLTDGAAISGRLLDANGSSPMSVSVFILDADRERMCAEYLYRGDDAFEFHGLRDGDYYLCAEDDAGLPWFYPGTTDPLEAEPISIRDGVSVDDIEWRLPPAAARTVR